jgi:alkylation response protein AidB-like acyl-CoA dehydrogenase
MRFDLTEEELMVQKLARDFTANEVEPLAVQIEQTNKTPRELLKKFADVGLLGITIPREYGGSGASVLSDVLVVEEVAKAGIGMEWLVSMNNSIGDTISHFASEELKCKYLPPVCCGDQCLSILFTEPATGSDPKMITTTAKLEGNHYIVNGEKRFISWAHWDGYGTLYAKDDDGKISCFVIEKGGKGYKTDPPYHKIGGHAQESVDVYFENMKVPQENLMGQKGKGFDMLLWWIAAEKIQQSAASLGIAEAALEESVKYAKERMLRNGPMAALQGIQWTLAEMKMRIEAIRGLVYRSACLREEQSPEWITTAALCKAFCVPAAEQVTLMGLRLHSGYGYTTDFKIGRLHKAVLGGFGIATSIELNKSIVGGSLVR